MKNALDLALNISSGEAATYLGTRSQGMIFVPQKCDYGCRNPWCGDTVILGFKLNSLT